MDTMGYLPGELLSVLERITRRYTSGESSSVTYETAQGLMGAIVYTIQGIREEGTVVTEKLPAAEAYRIGLLNRKEKVRRAKDIYDEIMADYVDLGNVFCNETIRDGMEAFFLNYNVEFAPQDHLLTLDYPMRQPIKGRQGIDLIYAYLEAFREEQDILREFPKDMLIRRLKAYHREYEELPVNLCEMLESSAGKPGFDQGADEKSQEAVFSEGDAMEDEKLRWLLGKMQDEDIDKKVWYIETYVRSLTDLKEVLGSVIWPDEFDRVFSMLSEAELGYLRRGIEEKEEFGSGLTEWEERFMAL